MGLRSVPLLVLLAALTTVLLVAVLRWWAALARPGGGGVLRRVVMLGALQASALALIFVWVNRSQAFYASWSDLLGTSAVAGRVVPADGTGPVSLSGTAARVIPAAGPGAAGSAGLPPGTPADGIPGAGGLSTGELRTGRLRAGSRPAGQLRPGQLWVGRLRAGRLTIGDRQAGDLRAGQLRAGGLRAGHARTGGPRAGQPRAVPLRPGQPPPGPLRPGQPRAGPLQASQLRAGGLRTGQLQAVRFPGPVSGITASGYVFLPPGYSPAGPPLPVIVLISGDLGSRTAAYGARHVAAAATAAMAARRLPELIIAMLPPSAGAPGGQGCLDTPGGPQATTFFTQDLPQLLRSSYRAAALPARWGVLGGPGGGYCALQLVTSADGPFSVAASASGGYLWPPRRAAATGWLRHQDSIRWRLRHWPAPPVRLLLPGPGAGGIAALARPPLRVTTVAPVRGTVPLAAVLAWAGRAVAAPITGGTTPWG